MVRNAYVPRSGQHGGRAGRGSNPGRGNGGGRYQSNSAPKATNKQKSCLEDARFDIGAAATRAVEYERNLRYLLNYIQQQYKGGDDIVVSIESKKHIDFNVLRPAPKVSALSDPAAAKAEQQMLDAENQEMGKTHAKRDAQYQMNQEKIYAFLWNQGTDALQHRIESHVDFETAIKNDHIKLIGAIEEHCFKSNLGINMT